MSQAIVVTSFENALSSGMSRRRPAKKRANVRDVAQLAEVSVATVSRVLNAPEVVQESTRKRVEAVIEKVGFVRSPAARAINSGRSQLLGALIPTLENNIFAMTLNSMEERLADFGFSLVVATTNEDPELETRKARELLDNGVEGLVVTGKSHSDELYQMLDRRQVPAIAISCFDPAFRLPTIGYDNFNAAAMAYDFLAQHGRERLAIIHGPTNFNDRTTERLQAISSSQSHRHHAIFETELSIEGGAKATERIIRSGERFDAILCLSDVLAFGALHETQRAGVRVPEDLSVMGMQDLPASNYTYPKLTTVHLPVRRMGHQAAISLARSVTDDARAQPVEFEAVIVNRETVARKA